MPPVENIIFLATKYYVVKPCDVTHAYSMHVLTATWLTSLASSKSFMCIYKDINDNLAL